MKRAILAILILIAGVVMVEVTSDGKDRIQTNDGKVGLSLSDNKIKVSDDDGQLINIDSQGLVQNDGTDDRMKIGREVRLSQPGVDVGEAPNSESIITDELNVFKIVAKYSGSVAGLDRSASALWGTNTYTHTHSLGYTPAYIGFIDGSSYQPGQRRAIPGGLDFEPALGYPWGVTVDAYVNSTTLTVLAHAVPGLNSTSITGTYTIYLLQERAN